VGVLEWRLRKGEQQAGRNAEMDQPTYQATLLYMARCPAREACSRATLFCDNGRPHLCSAALVSVFGAQSADADLGIAQPQT
jgi:hypothetical protein